MKTTMLEKKERLLQMYNYAVSNSICSNRKGFAEIIGISDKNLSNALSSNDAIADRFCTKGLLQKANAALNYSFNQQWLLTGEGEMLVSNNINIERTHTHAQETQGTNNDDRVAELESRVAELQSKVEMLEYIIETQKRLIKEIDQKRDKSVSANVHSA